MYIVLVPAFVVAAALVTATVAISCFAGRRRAGVDVCAARGVVDTELRSREQCGSGCRRRGGWERAERDHPALWRRRCANAAAWVHVRVCVRVMHSRWRYSLCW